MSLSRGCFMFALWLVLGSALAGAQCENCSKPEQLDEHCDKFPARAGTGEKRATTIACSHRSGGPWTWTITRPRVNQPLTEYPEIRFEKGQIVFVTARGYVNVANLTDKNKDKCNKADWRRYVDPEGDGTDRFYHGLVWIPGARIVHDRQLLVTPAGTAPVRISSLSPSNLKPSDTDESGDAEELVIDDTPTNPSDQTLRLGYEAGYRHPYPQNPYLPTGCHEAATVTVTIEAAPRQQDQTEMSQLPVQSRANPTRSLLPFDPVSNQTDLNGFMQAPMWFGNYGKSEGAEAEVWRQCDDFPYKDPLRQRVSHGVQSTCTQQASFDVPRLFTHCLLASAFGVLHGHVNWVPATYVGKLRFKEVSSDSDLDLQLVTIGDLERIRRFPGNESFGKMKIPPILTKDSQIDADYKNALWLEFASYETVKYFKTDSWQMFRAGQEKQEYKRVQQNYLNHTAIVTGLLNLDCVHECHTELHPVFAMALRTKNEEPERPEDSNILSDDPWMIFVRNAGNEGDCSQDEHYLNRTEYTFFLPAPPGASGELPHLLWADGSPRSNVAGLTWSQEPAVPPEKGIRLRISLRPIQKCGHFPNGKMVHVSGVLHVNWTESPSELLHQLNNTSTANTGDDPEKEIYDVHNGEEAPSCPEADLQPPADACSRSKKNPTEQFECEQSYLSKLHKAGDHTTAGGAWEAVKGYLGRDVGLFEEPLLYNGSTQIQPNFGGRYAVLQTALGSFEIDGAPPLIRRQVRSTNGTNLQVKVSDIMGGAKIKFTNLMNTYVEIKGGEMFRSASSGFAATPDFRHFQGHNGFLLIGGGIQPYGHEGTHWSLRISLGWLYLPSTGEHMIRLTVGPQIRFSAH